MLVIRNAQFDTLGLATFEAGAVSDLRQAYPDAFASAADDIILQFVRRGIAKARAAGFYDYASYAVLLHLIRVSPEDWLASGGCAERTLQRLSSSPEEVRIEALFSDACERMDAEARASSARLDEEERNAMLPPPAEDSADDWEQTMLGETGRDIAIV